MKNKLKSLLCVVLAGVMLITLAGCGKKEEEKKEEENKTIELGKWEGDVYTNKDLDLNFTLPAGWKVATDRELAKLMQLGEDILEEEGKYISEVAKLTSVYYLSATEKTTGNNIIIMSEKSTLSLDKYINTVKEQLKTVEQFAYEVQDEGTEKVGTKTFSTMTVRETSYGISQKYYIRQEGNVYLTILMTSISGDATFNKLVESFR